MCINTALAAPWGAQPAASRAAAGAPSCRGHPPVDASAAAEAACECSDHASCAASCRRRCTRQCCTARTAPAGAGAAASSTHRTSRPRSKVGARCSRDAAILQRRPGRAHRWPPLLSALLLIGGRLLCPHLLKGGHRRAPPAPARRCRSSRPRTRAPADRRRRAPPPHRPCRPWCRGFPLPPTARQLDNSSSEFGCWM